jgi:hypothetical protein
MESTGVATKSIKGSAYEDQRVKTIIAGSRSIRRIEVVEDAVAVSQFNITEIVSGMARGVDTLALEFAATHGIPVKQMPADWDKLGKSAGFRRNGEMANYADALIAIWDGKSKGTLHMINVAKERGLKVYVHFLGDYE